MIKNLYCDSFNKMGQLIFSPEQKLYFDALSKRQNKVYYECFADSKADLLLQRVFGVWHITTKDENADFEEVALFLKLAGAKEITCSPETANKLVPFYDNAKCNIIPLMKYNKQMHDFERPFGIKVKDINPHMQAFKLIKDAKLSELDFGEYYTARRSIEKLKAGYTVITCVGSKAVSTASVICQSYDKAMLGAVATDINHRSQGYACKLVSGLAYSLSKVRKEVFIACYNKAAYSVYIKAGFEQHGQKAVISIHNKIQKEHVF